MSQRTREIGVRVALGATRSNVVRMVLLEACGLVAYGVVVGGAAAILTLSLAALVASAIPARRAAGVDPIVALRAE